MVCFRISGLRGPALGWLRWWFLVTPALSRAEDSKLLYNLCFELTTIQPVLSILLFLILLMTEQSPLSARAHVETATLQAPARHSQTTLRSTKRVHRDTTGDASLVRSLAKGVKTEHRLKACLRNTALLKEDMVLYF